jgi:hypothetical protein
VAAVPSGLSLIQLHERRGDPLKTGFTKLQLAGPRSYGAMTFGVAMAAVKGKYKLPRVLYVMGFVLLTAVVMNSSISWDIPACSLLKINRKVC